MIFVLLIGVACFAYIMGSFNQAISDYDSYMSTGDNLGDLNAWLTSLESIHD